MATHNPSGDQPTKDLSTPARPEETQQRGREVARQRSAAAARPGAAQRSPTTPFSMMRRMMEDMESMFDLGPFSGREGGGLWNPQLEVFQRGDQLVVRADLPGLEKDQVRLEMTDDGLLIEGERNEQHEEREKGFYRSERSYGSFRRFVPLPEGINADTANADMKNGVLEVSFKMPEQRSKARRIEIGAGEGKTGSKKIH
jgi:HSP20 family protein